MIARVAVVTLVALLASIGCGPTPARAQASTQRIAGVKLEALVKPALHGVALGGDAALIPAFHVPDQVVPAGSASLAVGTALVSPSYVNVPIQISVDGKYNRTVFVGYRIQQYVKTAVATHDLVPGTVLSTDDVTMARVPFTGQRTNGTQVLVGRKIVSSLRAGQPVSIEYTQTNQIVKAGSTVVLIVHDGGVSVVAEVVARSSGGLGDDVAVYNPQTNKTLSGTVIGPDRVELNLSGAQ